MSDRGGAAGRRGRPAAPEPAYEPTYRPARMTADPTA